MFFENHYQISYVTPDLDLGIAAFKEQFGIENFRSPGGGGGGGQPVWTPKGEGILRVKAAVAFVGDLTIEVMEPVSGPDEIYRDFLVPGQPLRLHHLGMRCDDIEKVRTESERLGRPVVLSGEFKNGKFMYVDARATLGHYLEYVALPPEYWRR
jgi:hypothetical protein